MFDGFDGKIPSEFEYNKFITKSDDANKKVKKTIFDSFDESSEFSEMLANGIEYTVKKIEPDDSLKEKILAIPGEMDSYYANAIRRKPLSELFEEWAKSMSDQKQIFLSEPLIK